MPSTHRNRLVTAVSNTPGTTGALTVAAAASGYRTFTSGDNGLSFDVSIVDGTAWEIRTGCEYTHSGTSLARGTLEDSSTGSAISLTSAAVATVTLTSGKLSEISSHIANSSPVARTLSMLSDYQIKTDRETTSGDYFVAFPAAGTAVTICTRPAGEVGILTSIQMSINAGEGGFDARLRIYVDQETVASFDVDLGTLFLSHLDAHTGVGQSVGTDHIQTGIVGTSTHVGFSAANTMLSYQMQFPVPYSDGVIVEVYTPPGVSVPGSGTSLFWMVTRREGAASNLRLRSQGQTRVAANAAAAFASASEITLFDIPNNAGWMVWQSAACFGASNYSYLERPWKYFVDGSSSFDFLLTGGEEYGATGWYFGAQTRFAQPAVLLTATNNANYTTIVGFDLLKMHGGLKFGSQLKVICGNKAHYPASSDHKMGWCALYYVDITVPYAPTAPRSLASTAGNAQIIWTWTAPASIGSSAITGYTISLDNGGGTHTVAGNVLTKTVTGLTNGTSYTATVLATNSVGNSSSSAGVSATPAAGSVPGAPTGVSATAGNAQATVTFTAPSSDGGSTITGYTATSTPGSFTGTVSGATAAPITVTGLTNGTAYTFTVVATNVNGNSAASSASGSVTPSAGSAITDNFNRADASTLGTTTTGSKTWALFTASVSAGTAEGGIDSNRAYVRITGENGTGYAYVVTASADIDVTATLAVIGAAARYPGMIARVVDGDNLVLLQFDGTAGTAPSYSAYKKIAGSYTLLGSSTGITPTAGDVLRLVVTGTNTVSFYVNGTQFGPYTATGISASSVNAGLQAGTDTSVASSARFDDFSVA